MVLQRQREDVLVAPDCIQLVVEESRFVYLDLLNAEDVNFVRHKEGFQLLLLSLGEEASSTVPPSKPQTSSSWQLLGFVYVAG